MIKAYARFAWLRRGRGDDGGTPSTRFSACSHRWVFYGPGYNLYYLCCSLYCHDTWWIDWSFSQKKLRNIILSYCICLVQCAYELKKRFECIIKFLYFSYEIQIKGKDPSFFFYGSFLWIKWMNNVIIEKFLIPMFFLQYSYKSMRPNMGVAVGQQSNNSTMYECHWFFFLLRNATGI